MDLLSSSIILHGPITCRTQTVDLNRAVMFMTTTIILSLLSLFNQLDEGVTFKFISSIGDNYFGLHKMKRGEKYFTIRII